MSNYLSLKRICYTFSFECIRSLDYCITDVLSLLSHFEIRIENVYNSVIGITFNKQISHLPGKLKGKTNERLLKI